MQWNNGNGTVTPGMVIEDGAGNKIVAGLGYPASGISPVAGTFAATGNSAVFTPLTGRSFNIAIWGIFVGTVQLLRSTDGGANFLPITANGTTLETFTAPASEQWSDDQGGVQYKLSCAAFTSGTINYRISQ